MGSAASSPRRSSPNHTHSPAPHRGRERDRPTSSSPPPAIHSPRPSRTHAPPSGAVPTTTTTTTRHSHTHSGRTPRPPSPRRKKSLELPDLASLALTPVASRHGGTAPAPSSPLPPLPPIPTAALAYPPGPSNVPRNPAPHARHARGRASSDSRAPPPSRQPPPPPAPAPPPTPTSLTTLSSTIFSDLPAGLPVPRLSLVSSPADDTAEPEQEEKDGQAEEVPLQPFTFRWEGDRGQRISLAGTFLQGWRGRQPLTYDASTNLHSITLLLPPGTHRFKFVTSTDEWRCSPLYATASDGDGNLINHISLFPPHSPPSKSSPPPPSPSPLPPGTPFHPTDPFDPDDALGGRWDANPRSDLTSDALSPFWVSTPPTLLTSPHTSSRLPPPPALPRHLEKVILNVADRPGGQADGEDNSVLPLPNHVVLNHLTASAIRGGVMAVGITGRYGSKLVTTIYYRPVGL